MVSFDEVLIPNIESHFMRSLYMIQSSTMGVVAMAKKKILFSIKLLERKHYFSELTNSFKSILLLDLEHFDSYISMNVKEIQ